MLLLGLIVSFSSRSLNSLQVTCSIVPVKRRARCFNIQLCWLDVRSFLGFSCSGITGSMYRMVVDGEAVVPAVDVDTTICQEI